MAEATPAPPKESTVVVMERYEVRGIDDPDAFLGEGAFSMVWKGLDTNKNNKECAVKTYKVDPKDKQGKCVALLKFKRQIEVLQELAAPLDIEALKSGNPSLWSPDLEQCEMGNLFLQLYDYSRDRRGEPGMYKDGGFYVVTELASYSLQDYLTDRRDAKINLSIENVAGISYSILRVVASLHAKGLVHLDIKPENIMKISGHWKLIDVDGCVRNDEQISIDDATISFSPAYCSPEFARFPIGDSDFLTIKCSMDVWSIGLCIAELFLLDVLIGPVFAGEVAPGTKLDAGFAILEWLANPAPIVLPKKLLEWDKDFVSLLQSLLEKSTTARSTLAQALHHPFIMNNFKKADEEGVDTYGQAASKRNREKRHRARAVDKDRPIYADVLAKLNSDGDVMKAEDYLKRDFWLSANGCLCYFSKKENRALVLLDSQLVKGGTITRLPMENTAMPYVFELKPFEEGIERHPEYFAAESAEKLDKWLQTFESVQNTDLRKTANFRDVKAFRLRVRNQRKAVDDEASQPAFKSVLYKLNQDGDALNPEHWLKREMWIAKNGSLCYFSKKENRVLMYQNAEDVRESELRVMAPEESAIPHSFEMILPPKDQMEFEPCVFAAESDQEMEMWITQLQSLRPRTPSSAPKL